MADGRIEEANRERFGQEVQGFRRELRRTVERSGFKQWSADENDQRALTNVIGVGRSKLTAALDINKTTLPDPYLVRQIARHCDPESSYLTDYRDWVEEWTQASTEGDRAALPPRPSRAANTNGTFVASSPTAASADSEPSEPQTFRTTPADGPEFADDADRSPRYRLLRGAAALLALVVLVVGIGFPAGWWTAEPDSAGDPPGGPMLASATSDSTTANPAATSDAQPPPTGTGPWPYRVVNTGTLGLFIRTGPRETDVRLPGNPVAFDDMTLVADCQTTTDFDPDPDTGAKGRWLNIHWPESASPAGSYVYAGYTEPIGHSGDIPVCS